MRIDILSVMPELLAGPFEHSILKRAQSKGLLEVQVHSLRSFGIGRHAQLDDYAYGGGAGMVMMIEPVVAAIEHFTSLHTYDEIIFMTPDGERLEQKTVNQLSLKKNLLILCGHYKGVDERVRQHFITREISIGDYVLSGGELPAAVLVDAIGRLIPGVLNDETSALFDSFQDQLLAPPVYSRPAEFRGWKVPDILLSGNDKAIDDWRHDQSLERTRQRRPDLLREEGRE